MPIWLNYSPIKVGNWNHILPNYMFCMDRELWAKDWKFDTQSLMKMKALIQEWKLLEFLQRSESIQRFDEPLLRDIVLQAYPYEVEWKFLWDLIEDNTQRNEKLISLFDQFFRVSYQEVMDAYSKRSADELEIIHTTSSRVHQESYPDRDAAVTAYFLWLDTLLKSQWFIDEAKAISKFIKDNMVVRFREGISWVAFSEWEKIAIEVGNSTYVTLFHELTHLVAKYFRFTYYENFEVCFDNYTKTNEGLANYVAYHLFDGIMCANQQCVETVSHNELFFSPYIGVYAMLRNEWTNDKMKNFALVKEFMEEYEGSLLTEEKARFYFERFYKFFHYDQHEYFYPKELMYYLGYNQIRLMVKESLNPTQLLTQLLLWKVCL